ncbi:hypothetical protein BJY04DRAFT_182838 [Aspergillus karnatakaensis]|uniref:BAR and SH3 domain-containing protein n=1 Tax=Aspergillus karnatakaensis TaxID=1810916 RepID=UPI003CCE44D8
MQSVQRQFGRFMKRSADDGQVAILLKDFDQIDKLLDKIVDNTKAWRDAWSSLMTHQDRMLSEFETLYAPIIGAAEPTSHTPVLAPKGTLARTTKLKEEYGDLIKEFLEELTAIEDRMISPASQAKECLGPFKKTIKKREDRKLDYERHHGRVDNYSKRGNRSERENAAYAKAQEELARATDDYHAADENLRQHLPPLINAVFSLLPRLLSAQIEIQNKLLAHYYTVIYNYCEQEQFPSDPPQPLDQTVKEWEQACQPIQQQIEEFATIANGKAVRNARSPNDRRPSNTLGGLNKFRSNHSLPPAPEPKPAAYDSKPALGARSKSTPSAIPTPSTHPLPKYTPPASSSSSLLDPHSYSHSQPQTPNISQSDTPPPIKLSTKPSYTALATKKKPPPPPPKPRSASSNRSFVTALYDFAGQGTGDLVFHQGDRIRVLKKTDSTDDWWEGELHGVKGSFPANYVE